MPENIKVSTRTVHTITVELPDIIVDNIRDADVVELQLVSRAQNKQPAVIRLPWSTLQRLTMDL